MKPRDILKLVISIVACELAGVVGGIFTASAIPTWYAGVQKPSFTPPNWLFAPAWTTLYLLMGLSAFLVWRRGLASKGVDPALAIFLVQLILNVLWSIAFFGLRSPFGGVLVIVLLWAAIVLTIVWFFRVSRTASLLLMPYILWVTFAAALNVAIWLLNS